jgi:hypothetical protein
MLSRYSPPSGRKRSKNLEGTLQAHARLIYIISPNESVRLVLGRALADVQEKMGIKDLDAGSHKRWLLDSPSRPKFWRMRCVLEKQ